MGKNSPAKLEVKAHRVAWGERERRCSLLLDAFRCCSMHRAKQNMNQVISSVFMCIRVFSDCLVAMWQCNQMDQMQSCYKFLLQAISPAEEPMLNLVPKSGESGHENRISASTMAICWTRWPLAFLKPPLSS